MTNLLRKLETLEDSGTSRISRLSKISGMPRSSRCSRNARLAIAGFSPRSILKPCISRLQKKLIARPLNDQESGVEPDQNPTRTRPEVDNNPGGDNKTGNIGDNNPFGGDNKPFGGDNNHGRGDNKNEQRRPFAELLASAKQVFRALSDDNSMTQQGLCAKLGFSRKTIAKAIAVLIRERYIIRRGARKNGYWEVLP